MELCREAVKAGNPFDVVVLDIRMPPGMDGVQTAHKIRAIDDSVPVLFVSGFAEYSLEDLQDRLSETARVDLIEKPVQLGQLAAKIKRIAA